MKTNTIISPLEEVEQAIYRWLRIEMQNEEYNINGFAHMMANITEDIAEEIEKEKD
jgi:hypothetical protein